MRRILAVVLFSMVAVGSAMAQQTCDSKAVGKDGKPKKAVVVKEIPKDVFSSSASEAAMRYVFTPALMNSGPVQVWTVIRFKFQLSNKPVS